MGRHLSSSGGAAYIGGGLSGLPAYPGQLPAIGDGVWLAVTSTRVWNVPKTGRYRVRVIGGGGQPGIGPGGTTSFGALMSATGGAANAGLVGGAGGQGLGGDYQAAGGRGGDAGHATALGGGGGAAGSQMGMGGGGGASSGIGDGAANMYGGNGGSVAAPISTLNWLGRGDDKDALAVLNAFLPPYFAFVGPASFSHPSTGISMPGGSGAGGMGGFIPALVTPGRNAANGGYGAGGGGGGSRTASYAASVAIGASLLGGGRGGGTGQGGGGGGGFAMGEFTLIEGDPINLTVPSGGMIIIEY